MNDRCPKCGAKRVRMALYADFSCGTYCVRETGHPVEGEECLRRQRDQLESRVRHMEKTAGCVHCGEVLGDNDKGHWADCKNHPANIRIAELEATVETQAREIRLLQDMAHRDSIAIESLRGDLEALSALWGSGPVDKNTEWAWLDCIEKTNGILAKYRKGE